MMRFNDKVCLVTASATGIGLAICHQLAKEGAIVIISSRSQKNVDDAVDEIRKVGGRAEGMVCHAAKEQDVVNLIKWVDEKFGRLDVLVPNAAVSTFVGPTLDTSLSQFDKMYQTNVRGTFHLIKEALPLLQKTPKSNVVVISSYVGYELEPGIGLYAITKTSLIALVKLLSKELMPDGIRINSIAPGLIKTKFSSLLWKEKEQETIQNMRISRLGEVEDIAQAVAFIGSEQASYITGETLVVGGKTSSRL